DELVDGELVVVARVGAGGGRVDAQLRPDPANPADIRRRARQTMAVGSRLLRGQLVEHHAAGRTGAVCHVSASAATDLGCIDVGGVLAVGDGGRATRARAGTAWSGRRIFPG